MLTQETNETKSNNTNDTVGLSDYLSQIDVSVNEFEKEMDRELVSGETDTAKKPEHWFDAMPNTFTKAQRVHTTILHAGLTMAHDFFIQSAFRGLGYKVTAMDVPDNNSLQLGREFGNRGQCNPTYFTVGNLVKKLKQLENDGHSKTDIIENYIFATAGSCGPCRFGTYVTEYRKALRDSGFEGFRVMLFQQAGGIKQATGDELGLQINATFFATMSKAVVLGDVLNALMYRIRPYELEKGATDKVLAEAKKNIGRAFETRKGMMRALWNTRKALAEIKVDKTQVKPRVAIIGEFWAMTTEGDGNYKMHRFLEEEGAEVDIQLVTNWGLYLIWAAKYDTLKRRELRGADMRLDDSNPQGSKFGLRGVDVAKKLWSLRGADTFLRGLFTFYSKILGLRDYHLPDMDHIAQISHKFYDNNLRGGEGHMEVGKLIHNVVDQKVNMTLSIKPFGCMPSSAVSDGVQSLITEMYPTAIFLPIETNGDGAVNVYSRVQMQLFKAKQSAQKEYAQAMEGAPFSEVQFKEYVEGHSAFSPASYRSPHFGACGAVDLVADVEKRKKPIVAKWFNGLVTFSENSTKAKKRSTLAKVARAAERHEQEKSSGPSEAVKFVEA